MKTFVNAFLRINHTGKSIMNITYKFLCFIAPFVILINGCSGSKAITQNKTGAVWGRISLYGSGSYVDTNDYTTFEFKLSGVNLSVNSNKNGFFLLDDVPAGYYTIEVLNKKLLASGKLKSNYNDSVLLRFDCILVVTDSLTSLAMYQQEDNWGYLQNNEITPLKKPVGMGNIKGQCVMLNNENGQKIPLPGLFVSIRRVLYHGSLEDSTFKYTYFNERDLWFGYCDKDGFFYTPEMVTGSYIIHLERNYTLVIPDKIGGFQVGTISKGTTTNIEIIAQQLMDNNPPYLFFFPDSDEDTTK